MSEKEMAARLLENIPTHKLGYVIAYLQGLMADEEADDAFCESLVDSYESDPDKGQFISLEEAAKMCGVSLDEL